MRRMRWTSAALLLLPACDAPEERSPAAPAAASAIVAAPSAAGAPTSGLERPSAPLRLPPPAPRADADPKLPGRVLFDGARPDEEPAAVRAATGPDDRARAYAQLTPPVEPPSRPAVPAPRLDRASLSGFVPGIGSLLSRAMDGIVGAVGTCYAAVADGLTAAGLIPGRWVLARHGTSAFRFGEAYDRGEPHVRRWFAEIDPRNAWPYPKGSVMVWGPGQCRGFTGFHVEHGHIEVAVGETPACRDDPRSARCAVLGRFYNPAPSPRHFEFASAAAGRIDPGTGARCLRVFAPVDAVRSAG